MCLFRAGEICCEDIGCFTDDPPYDHYRLPRCPDDLPTSFELFTRDNNDGEDFKRNEIPWVKPFEMSTDNLIHVGIGSGGSRISQTREGRWAATLKVLAPNLFWTIVPKNCMKMKKKWTDRGRGGSLAPPSWICQCLFGPNHWTCKVILLCSNNYHLDKRTILLIHGYMNDRNSDYLFHLKDAILTLVSEIFEKSFLRETSVPVSTMF